MEGRGGQACLAGRQARNDMSFQSHQGRFTTADDLKLFYRFYDAGAGADTLLILHGMGEHSGRYEKFQKFLEGKNLSIAVFDYRGHGLSEGDKVYVNSFDDYLKDVETFTAFLKDQHQVSRKIFLLGHSMGGLMAFYFALKYSDQLQSLILSAPCFGVPGENWIRPFNQFMNAFAPKFYYRNPVNWSRLSHDPEEVKIYLKDTLIHRQISVRLLHEMLRCGDDLNSKETFKFHCPVYVLSAGIEKIVSAGRIESIFRKISAPDKDLKNYPGFYHEIFNETRREEVFRQLLDFIERGRRFS